MTNLTNFNPDDYSKLVDRWLKAEKEGELYPVEFDLAWKIAGYSNKANAKCKLNRLKDGRDFLSKWISHGSKGRPEEMITLTVEGFIGLCLISSLPNPVKSTIFHYATNGKIQFGSGFSDSDRSGFVYLVRASKTSFYKIGCSKKPYQRLQSLQTGSPLEIKIIERIFSFDFQGLEKDLHDYYSADWLRGEWFYFPEEVVREFVSTANDLDKTREETLPLIDHAYKYETI